ncbi:MAG: MFS transporter [Woeseiaceae bacterium]|nr:MFS transporter [Woeseiaceae bacterium]MDX2606746.1 MFS transporter [Woeseiaceae bacterium]
MSFATQVIDNGKVSRQQILVVVLCMFFNMVDGFDIIAMAVVAGEVSREMMLPADKVGWIFSFALAGMVAGAMLLAPISDIVGRRKVIVVSIIVVGVSILLTANATTLTEFIALRFTSGLGAGVMLASQATLAAEYSPEKYRSLSVTFVTSGYALGAMLTSVAAGLILPDYGWRGMFWFGGAATLVMGIVAWLLIPESLKYLLERRPGDALRRINKILTKLNRESLLQMPDVEPRQQKKSLGMVQVMSQLLAKEHRKVTLTLWTTFFLAFSALYFLLSWIPILIEDSGFSAADARDAFFLFNLGGVIGVWILGILSTRWKLTNIVFTLMFSASIFMVIFAAIPGDIDFLLTLIFIIGLLQQGGFTGLYAAAAKAYPTSMRSTGIGWSIGLGRLGAVAGPAIAGYLIASGFDMSANFYIFAVPLAASAIIAYRLHLR